MSSIAESGLLGVVIPRPYGGLGASTTEYVAALEHLGHADSAIALTCQAHILATEIYSRFGSEDQKARWLPRFARGQALSGIAMTEPDAGSDLLGISTTAVPDGNEWILDGCKTFIANSGATLSDGLLVLAKTGFDDRHRPTHGFFIVPAGTPGFRRGPRMRMLGWSAMDTREVTFTNCRIPASHAVGDPREGMLIAKKALALGRIAFASIAVGMAQACLDLALDYARQRHQFGKPISQFQAIQFKLADMLTDIRASRALAAEAARLRDAQAADWEVTGSMAKLFACRSCVRAADEAVQIFGGRGFLLDSEISKFYADAKMMEIGDGTSEMHRMIIARSMGC